MQSTAQLWLVYRLTHSVALLGVFAFANQIPILVLAPFGGYVGDHYNRRQAVIWTQTVSLFLALALAALTLLNVIRVWEIIGIAFLVGIVNAFDVPIRQAFLVEMVGKEDLPNAIALNSSIVNGARVTGPAIAGFVIGWIGEGWCFFLNGISFVAVIIALMLMRITRVEARASKGSPFQNFFQGFRFIINDRPLRSVLLLLGLLNMLGLQYPVFLPVFANDILHRGARGLGLLFSFAGVGALFGALHFAGKAGYRGLVEWIAATSATCALGLVLFSQSRVFWLSAALLLVAGFSATSQMAATNTIVQGSSPDGLRSRIMAVYTMMFLGIQPIGALIAGGVAKRIGAPHALAIFGTIFLLGSATFVFRVALRIEHHKPRPNLRQDWDDSASVASKRPLEKGH
jgi:MFS family permease